MPKETNDYVTKIGHQLRDLSTYYHTNNGSTPPTGVHYSGTFDNRSINFDLMILGGATFNGNIKATNLIRNRFRTVQSLNYYHLMNIKPTLSSNSSEIVQYDYTNTFNGQPAIVLLTGRTITFEFAKTPLFASEGDRRENSDVFNVYSNVLDDVTDKEDGSVHVIGDHTVDETLVSNQNGFKADLTSNKGHTENIDVPSRLHYRYWNNQTDQSTLSSRLKALNVTVNSNTKYTYTLEINNGLVATVELWPPQITTNYGVYQNMY